MNSTHQLPSSNPNTLTGPQIGHQVITRFIEQLETSVLSFKDKFSYSAETLTQIKKLIELVKNHKFFATYEEKWQFSYVQLAFILNNNINQANKNIKTLNQTDMLNQTFGITLIEMKNQIKKLLINLPAERINHIQKLLIENVFLANSIFLTSQSEEVHWKNCWYNCLYLDFNILIFKNCIQDLIAEGLIEPISIMGERLDNLARSIFLCIKNTIECGSNDVLIDQKEKLANARNMLCDLYLSGIILFDYKNLNHCLEVYYFISNKILEVSKKIAIDEENPFMENNVELPESQNLISKIESHLKNHDFIKAKELCADFDKKILGCAIYYSISFAIAQNFNLPDSRAIILIDDIKRDHLLLIKDKVVPGNVIAIPITHTNFNKIKEEFAQEFKIIEKKSKKQLKKPIKLTDDFSIKRHKALQNQCTRLQDSIPPLKLKYLGILSNLKAKIALSEGEPKEAFYHFNETAKLQTIENFAEISSSVDLYHNMFMSLLINNIPLIPATAENCIKLIWDTAILYQRADKQSAQVISVYIQLIARMFKELHYQLSGTVLNKFLALELQFPYLPTPELEKMMSKIDHSIKNYQFKSYNPLFSFVIEPESELTLNNENAISTNALVEVSTMQRTALLAETTLTIFELDKLMENLLNRIEEKIKNADFSQMATITEIKNLIISIEKNAQLSTHSLQWKLHYLQIMFVLCQIAAGVQINLTDANIKITASLTELTNINKGLHLTQVQINIIEIVFKERNKKILEFADKCQPATYLGLAVLFFTQIVDDLVSKNIIPPKDNAVFQLAINIFENVSLLIDSEIKNIHKPGVKDHKILVQETSYINKIKKLLKEYYLNGSLILADEKTFNTIKNWYVVLTQIEEVVYIALGMQKDLRFEEYDNRIEIISKQLMSKQYNQAKYNCNQLLQSIKSCALYFCQLGEEKKFVNDNRRKLIFIESIRDTQPSCVIFVDKTLLPVNFITLPIDKNDLEMFKNTFLLSAKEKSVCISENISNEQLEKLTKILKNLPIITPINHKYLALVSSLLGKTEFNLFNFKEAANYLSAAINYQTQLDTSPFRHASLLSFFYLYEKLIPAYLETKQIASCIDELWNFTFYHADLENTEHLGFINSYTYSVNNIVISEAVQLSVEHQNKLASLKIKFPPEQFKDNQEEEALEMTEDNSSCLEKKLAEFEKMVIDDIISRNFEAASTKIKNYGKEYNHCRVYFLVNPTKEIEEEYFEKYQSALLLIKEKRNFYFRYKPLTFLNTTNLPIKKNTKIFNLNISKLKNKQYIIDICTNKLRKELYELINIEVFTLEQARFLQIKNFLNGLIKLHQGEGNDALSYFEKALDIQLLFLLDYPLKSFLDSNFEYSKIFAYMLLSLFLLKQKEEFFRNVSLVIMASYQIDNKKYAWALIAALNEYCAKNDEENNFRKQLTDLANKYLTPEIMAQPHIIAQEEIFQGLLKVYGEQSQLLLSQSKKEINGPDILIEKIPETISPAQQTIVKQQEELRQKADALAKEKELAEQKAKALAKEEELAKQRAEVLAKEKELAKQKAEALVKQKAEKVKEKERIELEKKRNEAAKKSAKRKKQKEIKKTRKVENKLKQQQEKQQQELAEKKAKEELAEKKAQEEMAKKEEQKRIDLQQQIAHQKLAIVNLRKKAEQDNNITKNLKEQIDKDKKITNEEYKHIKTIIKEKDDLMLKLQEINKEVENTKKLGALEEKNKEVEAIKKELNKIKEENKAEQERRNTLKTAILQRGGQFYDQLKFEDTFFVSCALNFIFAIKKYKSQIQVAIKGSVGLAVFLRMFATEYFSHQILSPNIKTNDLDLVIKVEDFAEAYEVVNFITTQYPAFVEVNCLQNSYINLKGQIDHITIELTICTPSYRSNNFIPISNCQLELLPPKCSNNYLAKDCIYFDNGYFFHFKLDENLKPSLKAGLFLVHPPNEKFSNYCLCLAKYCDKVKHFLITNQTVQKPAYLQHLCTYEETLKILPNFFYQLLRKGSDKPYLEMLAFVKQKEGIDEKYSTPSFAKHLASPYVRIFFDALLKCYDLQGNWAKIIGHHQSVIVKYATVFVQAYYAKIPHDYVITLADFKNLLNDILQFVILKRRELDATPINSGNIDLNSFSTWQNSFTQFVAKKYAYQYSIGQQQLVQHHLAQQYQLGQQHSLAQQQLTQQQLQQQHFYNQQFNPTLFQAQQALPAPTQHYPTDHTKKPY